MCGNGKDHLMMVSFMFILFSVFFGSLEALFSYYVGGNGFTNEFKNCGVGENINETK